MIINEFLPNPIGKDVDGEWIELFNNSQEIVNLSGWQIKDKAGKTFSFGQLRINPDQYLVLNYQTTKISLNNNGETLYLYNQKGGLIDKAEFTGTASEGQSLIRQGDYFVFTDQPTPGAINISNRNVETRDGQIQPSGTLQETRALTQTSINFNNLLIGLSVALVLAFIFVMIGKKLNLWED
jgi:hypothetical protein